MENLNYCMSAYLTFRYIEDENTNFFAGLSHKVFKAKNQSLICECETTDDISKVI
jgi:hypothetical protein